MKKPKIIKISIRFECPFCLKKSTVIPTPIDFTGWSYEGSEEHYADSGVKISFQCPKCNKISETDLTS
jgi:hypothetical protein